jgi:hypothetical protein
MTIEELKARILEIEDIGVKKGDCVLAHAFEDRLLWDFIEYVACRHGGILADKAKVILTSKTFAFRRWYV